MNINDLIDCLVGGLDDGDPVASEFERRKADDPAFAGDADRLERSLRLLLDDGQGPAPPADLAERTARLVAAYRRPGAVVRPPEWGSTRNRFTWADLAVAAGILIAGLLTLLPATQRSHKERAQLACLANLHQIGLALNRYAMDQRVYPYPDPGSTATQGHCFASILHEAGLLDDRRVLLCPCSSHKGEPPASPTGPRSPLAPPGPAGIATGGDYAYHRGIRPAVGRPMPLPARFVGQSVPILSDQPPHSPTGLILRGNSPNHRGIGQNVLFTGGHAQFRRTRANGQADPDLFLNNLGRPEPGLSEADASLGPPRFPLFPR